MLLLPHSCWHFPQAQGFGDLVFLFLAPVSWIISFTRSLVLNVVVTHMNGEKISSFLLEIAKDISLHRTETNEDITICGAIGEGHSMSGNVAIFRSQMKKEHFTFFADPTPSEVSTLKTCYYKASYYVQTMRMVIIMLEMSLVDKTMETLPHLTRTSY